MASKAVEAAVEARLAANWTKCPVLQENAQGEAPADGSPFLVLQFPVANVRRRALGERFYHEEGGFRIVINVERGAGTSTIRNWGEELEAIFRDRTFDGVHCQVPSAPFTDDQSDQGNYFSGSLVVPYWFTFSDP